MLVAGGLSAEDTPVPISNTVVKLCRADGTAGGTWWESTSPPAHMLGPFLLRDGPFFFDIRADGGGAVLSHAFRAVPE